MPKSVQPAMSPALTEARILLLAKCSRIVTDRAEALVRRVAKLSLREVWVLLAASGQAPMTQKQLASHLSINPNTLVTLLDGLEKTQHVRRLRNSQNRREQFVRLTAKGKGVARRVLTAKKNSYRTILAPLDDRMIAAIFEAAERVLASEN